MAVDSPPLQSSLLALLLLLLALLLPRPAEASSPQDPLNSLARLLGVQKVPAHLRGSAGAPLFLRRLFDSVSEADGRAVRAVPYHSDSVVAYADWAPSSQSFYTYNLTRLPYQSSIRYADLHLFRAPSIASGRRSRRRREAPSEPVATSRIVRVKLYQVTDPRRRGTPYGNILLSQKLLPLDYRGWVVFEVSQAALSWIESSGATNHGLAVFAYYASGDPVPPGRLGFVQRGENRDVLQPALMVYASEGGNRRSRPELESNAFNRAFDSFDPNRYARVYGGSFALTANRRLSRSRRAAAASAATESASSELSVAAAGQHAVSVTCRRYPMYVDFAKVGWDEWIIGPPGFNAFFCSGHCPFPLGQQFHPSNHAVVQSIMNHLGPQISGPVQKPSCVPSKLDSISMLYYDDNDRVVLKQYDDMIALACGCQ